MNSKGYVYKRDPSDHVVINVFDDQGEMVVDNECSLNQDLLWIQNLGTSDELNREQEPQESNCSQSRPESRNFDVGHNDHRYSRSTGPQNNKSEAMQALSALRDEWVNENVVRDERLERLEGSMNELTSRLVTLTRVIENANKVQVTNITKASPPREETDSQKPVVSPAAVNNCTSGPRVKDITELTEEKMDTPMAASLITNFVDAFRAMGGSEESRVRSAFTRMDPDMKCIAQLELKERNAMTLDVLEEILLEAFIRPESAVESVAQLQQLRFSLEEDDPFKFYKRLKIRHSAIRSAFPGKKVRKIGDILQGIVLASPVPNYVKEIVKACVDEDKSMEIVRQLNQAKVSLGSSASVVAQVRNTECQAWDGGRRQDAPRRRFQPCPWCQDGSKHSRQQCPRKPEPRSCFDCLAPNQFKWHEGCPGRNVGSAARNEPQTT